MDIQINQNIHAKENSEGDSPANNFDGDNPADNFDGDSPTEYLGL